mgnify:CR=1 FL=1
MTKQIFGWCVSLLEWLAEKLGMTYEAVNVWIFCVIWPLLTLALVAALVWRWIKPL